MPQMVAHFLERQPRLDQMPGTGVPQTVGTAAFPWPVCGRQMRSHDVIERAGGERPEGCPHGQEERRLIALWPGVAKIAADGTLDAGFEREKLSMPTFGTDDADAVGRRVDIPDLKSPNFARPQAIDGRQSQHRPVAPLQRGIAIGFGDHAGHGVPRRSDRNAFLTINARHENRGCQPRTHPAFRLAMAEPDPQGHRRLIATTLGSIVARRVENTHPDALG